MKKTYTTLAILVFILLGFFIFRFQNSAQPIGVADDTNDAVTDTGSLSIDNQGGFMEGHTPRGFSGMGTGLFAGDNLNPSFPEGDGVQIFLTFDLSVIERRDITNVILRSGVPRIEGTPFTDLGALRAEEIRYDAFSRDLWNLEPREFSCIFADNPSGPFNCDVTEAVQNSLDDNYSFAQFRILFDEAGDSDGVQDMIFFNTSGNANTNKSGLFELVVE